MSKWHLLFDDALSIIAQANRDFLLVDSWSFGGGTALMLQIDHRDSYDVDIFIDDPQVLPYLNPATQGYHLTTVPSEYESDGTKALKIFFEGIGEIDFICAASVTDHPHVLTKVREKEVFLETPAEIIAKKIVYRGSHIQPRDLFDIASTAKSLGKQYVVDALRPFVRNAEIALAAAEKLKPDLVRQVNGKLICHNNFHDIRDAAQDIAIEILKAVCGPRPKNDLNQENSDVPSAELKNRTEEAQNYSGAKL